MIVVKCPKCGASFPVADPEPPLFVHCPACHKALRLRRKLTEEEVRQTRAAARRRKLRRVLRPVPTVLAVAALVCLWYGGRYVYSFMHGRKSNHTPAGPATTRPGQASTQGIPSAYQDQLKLARVRGRPRRLGTDKLFDAVSPAVVRVIVQSASRRSVGQGSGFIVSANGWVVTNYHVIEWADTATVVMADYKDLLVEGVAAVDQQGDLALLKVRGRGLPSLLISTDPPPRVGTKVFAIGSPAGLPNTLSDGLVSGHRTQHGVPVLQTTAPVSHGSSGGPLLTDEGLVVGVTSRIRAGGQNLNFAATAGRLHDLLRKQGKIIPLAELHGKPLKEPVIVQLDRAWRLMEGENWDAADAILKPLASVHTDNPFVLFAYGHFHRKRGYYKLAIRAFEAAVRLKPDYAEAYYNIGVTYCDREALAAIVHDHSHSLELDRQAREAFLKAARFDPVGKIGRAAREALAKHWPRQFPPK